MISINGAKSRQFGRLFATLTLLLAAQGCVNTQSAPAPPQELLKQSMARYAALTTFQADCGWNATYGGLPSGMETKRSIWYQKPNRFKVVSSHGGTSMVQTSVSDGKRLVEFTTGFNLPAQSYAAPPSIADAASMQMGHPMFCGSLLYRFFGGPARVSALVDEAKMPVSFGAPVTLEGQECKTVKFWAQGPMYGKTEVAIGTTDHLVHRIRYGSEPLMQMMQSGAALAQLKQAMQSPEVKKQMEKAGKGANQQAMQDALNNMKNLPTSSLTTETYVHIAVDKPLDPAVFTTRAPAGQPVQEVGGGSELQPPVAFGKPAPEISITGMDGIKQKLAAFKGRVVLIDFWATWCPPCRKGLPETQQFYTEYGQRGLAVLTISDEAKATVTPFIRQNRYTFPVYLDAGGVTNRAYNIAAIPTTVVIDRNGNLVAYKVGLSPREDILAALKKAGLDTR